MKKPWKALFLLLIVCTFAAIFTLTVSAASSGLDFKSNGDGTCVLRSIGSCTDTNVVIPTKSPKGDRVTAIGDRAFYNCSDLISVTIPDGVTAIGKGAFCYSSGLTSVSIPTSVKVIGDDAFEACLALTSVTIPDGVVTIGSSAFRSCEGIKTVSIPQSVKEIGDCAFFHCVSLESVKIPDGVKIIGYSTFHYCSALKSVTLGSGIIGIGSSAFCGCESLSSLTIPQNVREIGDSAFRGCKGITSLTIPKNVSSIGDNAFADCSGLSSISVDAGNEKYKVTGNCLISKGTNTLVLGCKNSVIPTDGSVTSVGSSAFRGCTGLKSLSIPNTVTEIGSRAFSGCTGLASVTIPQNVSAIGLSAFEYCTGLTSISVSSGNAAYKSVGNCLVDKGTKTLIAGCKKSEIPSDGSVTAIAGFAFRGCTGLESVTIPDRITAISSGAFTDCEALKSITFLNRTMTISFALPDRVTVIGYAGSTAQSFAAQNNNPFKAYGGSADDPVTPPPEDCGAKDAGKVKSGYTPTGTPIRTLADLQNMKENGSYYLANDIDAKGFAMIPAFSGTFDGNGHKIYNLSAPLFGTLSGASFKNLTVVSAIVLQNSTSGIAVKDPDTNAGIAAGAIAVTANGAGASFTNVKASVNLSIGSPVTGKAILSGIIGTVTAGNLSFENCEVTGSIISTDYASGYTIGENGYNASVTFINCTNNSVISGTTKCSGYLGDGRNTTLTFRNCYNAGKMTCASNSGGYVGYHGGTIEITDSINVADITISSAATGQSCVGGFIGKANNAVTIRSCTNEGDIICPGNAIVSTGENAAGGIIGTKRNGGNLTIENCQNSGNIYKVGEYAGGIIGDLRNGANATIKGCTNTGNVTATEKCPAGIVGEIYGTFSGSILIENCANKGLISSVVNEKASIPGVVAYNSVGSACKIVNSYCRHQAYCNKSTVCILCGTTNLSEGSAEIVHVDGCGHALCKHLNTERVGAIPAKCTENGFTGDLCCKDCGRTLENGTATKKLGHSVGKDGICTRCKQVINPVATSVTTQVVTPTTTAITTAPVTTAPITTSPVTTAPVTTPPITTTPVTTEPATSPVTNPETNPAVDPATNPVTDPIVTHGTPQTDPVKKDNTTTIIVLAVAAVIAGSIAAIVVVRKKKKK